MVELGLYGIARVYWSMFGQGLGHRAAISDVFLTLGVATADATIPADATGTEEIDVLPVTFRLPNVRVPGPVTDRLAMVPPTRSASSVSDIRRSSSNRSRWTRIGMALDRQLGFAAQAGPFAEHFGEHKDHQHLESANHYPLLR